MYDRIRFIDPKGRITVRDLAFSQLCELLREFTDGEKASFDAGTALIVRVDNAFALAGTNIKLVTMGV